ncbi:hypothetical protein [Brucella sp. IR073]|uniref:hypothetical protein n=1 Tax=unclassified Brucella TaxID=2632610 RepID=UPI003B987260
MTTIAYRDGIMAADSGCWAGDASHGWAEKIAKGPDGVLYGTSGRAAKCFSFLDWVRGGYQGARPEPAATSDAESDFIVLMATAGRGVRVLTAFGEEHYPEAPYFAIGGGSVAAFGALYAGASAQVAIEAAIEHGTSAFGRVRCITHD